MDQEMKLSTKYVLLIFKFWKGEIKKIKTEKKANNNYNNNKQTKRKKEKKQLLANETESVEVKKLSQHFS